MGRSVYKQHKNFRVLLVYPNIQMSALMPQAIGIFTAILKDADFNVDLFDCTFYSDSPTDDTNQEKVTHKQVLPYDWSERGVEAKTGILEDFKRKVEAYDPDLIAVSVLESTYFLGLNLLRALTRRYPTLMGGVFATYAPEKIIQEDLVDYVCRGEGDEALVDFCCRLADGEPIENTLNFWIKKDGNIFRNTMRPSVDIDTIPVPDWSLFDEQSIYRPMQGKIYRAIGIETQRGCPYTCTFCNSPTNNQIYSSEVGDRFYRKKSIKRVREELDTLVERYDPELMYFVVDTFLAMSDSEFDELVEMYDDYRIPFWMNTRAETVTEHRAEGLERMNMLRMNIGIEHGNSEYRKRMLKRNVSDDTMLRAFDIAAEKSYTTVANSIIGMPDETRELIFDTINFNRRLPDAVDASGAFIFAPYHGTGLRDYAVSQGYLNDDMIISMSNCARSVLDMPTITAEEIQQLARTFSFYVKFGEERFPEIRIAEQADEGGEASFDKLSAEFDRDFRGQQIDATDDGIRKGAGVRDLHG